MSLFEQVAESLYGHIEIEVIEVDQFTSTGNITSLDFDTVAYEYISGGDSETARVCFGGHFNKRKVKITDSPNIGRVWFKRGENGKCEQYKANYDTSD